MKKKFTRDEAVRTLDEEITPILEDHGVILCWETFINEHRLFRNPYEIYRFCVRRDFYGMCCDFSHIPDVQGQIVRQIREFKDFILVYHVSNREKTSEVREKPLNHIPIFSEKGILDFHKIFNVDLINSNSSLVLEYRKEFSWKLKEDLELLRIIFNWQRTNI